MKTQASLKTTLTCNFILVATLPILIIGLLTLHNLTRSLEREITTRNLILAKSLAGETERFLKEPGTILRQIEDIVDQKQLLSSKGIRDYMDSIIANYGFFELIMMLDPQGVVKHLSPHREGLMGVTMAGQEYFRAASRLGKPYWSRTFLSPQTSQSTVALCIPLQGGMLVGYLNLAVLNSITEKVRIGSKGYAVIVDNIGTIIAHPNPSFVSQRLNVKNLAPVREGLIGREGTFRYRFMGEEKVGSVAQILQTGWVVAIFQPVEEAFAPVKKIRRIILSGTLAAVTLAVIIALISLRKALQPLARFTKESKRIADGDYSYPLRPPSYREVHDLEKNFQSMVEAIKHREEKLLHIRNKLNNIIDSMPSVLVGVDREGKITEWNLEAEKLAGVAAGNARGRLLGDAFPPLAGEMENVKQAIKKRTPVKTEKVPRETGGETRFADITVYPLITDQIEGAVIRMDDVTGRVRLEEMIIQSEKMVSVGGLAAGMAHEINNPLAGMLQNAQVLRNRLNTALPKNRRVAEECGLSMEAMELYMTRRNLLTMINAILESGERASRIVTNMLHFSRKSEGEAAPRHLGELLDQTIDLASSDYDLKKIYDFKNIQIVRQYDPDLPAVTCEAAMIQQVFLNILKNGAHAMAEETVAGEKARFILRVMREGPMARVEIENNGPEIPEDVRRRIFEPFFTTKKVGAGTGLGLSISYFIITEHHGGTMAVECAPGRGPNFIIRLPIETVA